MRIREIELVGFKSFREPTRVSLSPGINAIVGPNGCGKSNVVDAVRWALGEMSVKHLRAHDMQDVIFGGNAKSQPLNFAEVSLVFEQADDSSIELAGEAEGLAAQVARQHEFTITRRIFRSGDSQYLINQAPARLRDITELFLGSGVGPKAYAIIEQGRVGHIVGAKPEELRLFLEEAAGTTRFRARKLAAERKLERTGENLSRVQDVMREIDRQLGTLRRQAKRAEEYRALERELSETEIALAGARWGVLARERADLAERLGEVERRAAECQAAVESAEAARAAATEAEQRIAREIEAAFAAVADASGKVVRATERQRAARQSEEALRERLRHIEGEIETLGTSSDGALRSVSIAEGQRGEWLARQDLESEALGAAERETVTLAPKFERLQGEHALTSRALSDAHSRAVSVATKRAECAARLASVGDERDRLKARLFERERDAGLAKVRLERALEARGVAQRAQEQLAESRRSAALVVRSREDERRRLEETLTAAREVLLQVRGRLEGLCERERALEGYADGLGSAMRTSSALRGLVVEALVVPTDLERAVAAALGDTLRGAVVDTAEDAVRVVEGLRASRAGGVTLVPLADGSDDLPPAEPPPGAMRMESLVGAVPGREAIRRTLLRSIWLTDDLPSAARAWRASRGRAACVTRTGDVVDQRGVVSSGRRLGVAQLLERRREIGELETQVCQDETRQVAIEGRLAEVRDECADLAAGLADLDAEGHAAALELVSHDHGVENAIREVAAAERAVITDRSDLETTDGAFVEAASAAEAAEAVSRATAGAIGASEGEVVRVEGELANVRATLEAIRLRRDSLREALAEARERVALASSEVARLQHEAAALASRRDEGVAQREIARREALEHARALEELELDLGRSRSELASAEATVEQVRERSGRAQIEVREQDASLARARRGLDEERGRAREIEVRLAERSARIEALASTAVERHGVDASRVEVPETFDESIAIKRIAEIKERIERLGDVNVAAIADARELEERFSFLETQRSDLESSMDDLRRTIAELSRATRTKFRDTFEQADQRFQEFFAELFRGGRAALRLTNPQNLLESGVEMEVQPPGKSIRALEALSGGERALTAISLLMALFSLRATPFCILDEVDAPLDDVNLERFNAMVRRMSERTQFVVVTHKQPTMVSADALYGVTMAEAGVSQLVSVELPARDRVPRLDELKLAASA